MVSNIWQKESPLSININIMYSLVHVFATFPVFFFKKFISMFQTLKGQEVSVRRSLALAEVPVQLGGASGCQMST